MKLPRFNLRVLLLLVTIAGVAMGWVMYQLNWIRERHEFLAKPGVDWFVKSISEYSYIPWHLRLFGERSTWPWAFGSSIEPRYLDVPPELVDEGRRLFPETIITGIRLPTKN